MLYSQAVLLVALILGTFPFTQAGPYGVNIESSICCKDFVHFPLPLRILTDFYYTSSTCRKRGVILLTMKDREICADPRKTWVKHALMILQKKK